MAISQLTFTVWLIVGTISTLLFLLILIMFGRLIKLQVKIWFLAKRGFHLVEHIGMNKMRNYFYLRPKDNKFEFKSGFYMHYPETTTKTSSLLPPTPGGYKFLKINKIDDNVEVKRLEETVSKLVYDSNAVTLRWGIPIITYVGNSPYPINFSEPSKEYGAQVIRDIYIRLLATEQYGMMKKMITIGIVVMAGVAIALVLLFLAYKSTAGNTSVCLQSLNSTHTQLLSCVRTLTQNSTIMV